MEDGYRLYIAMSGWMIPVSWVAALPEGAHEIYAGQTLWQWISMFGALLLASLLGCWVIRWSPRGSGGARSSARKLLGPIALVLLPLGGSTLSMSS